MQIEKPYGNYSHTVPAFVPLPIAPAAPASGDIRIEVRRGNMAIKIEWPAQSSSDCAAWLRDWLR